MQRLAFVPVEGCRAFEPSVDVTTPGRNCAAFSASASPSVSTPALGSPGARPPYPVSPSSSAEHTIIPWTSGATPLQSRVAGTATADLEVCRSMGFSFGSGEEAEHPRSSEAELRGCDTPSSAGSTTALGITSGVASATTISSQTGCAVPSRKVWMGECRGGLESGGGTNRHCGSARADPESPLKCGQSPTAISVPPRSGSGRSPKLCAAAAKVAEENKRLDIEVRRERDRKDNLAVRWETLRSRGVQLETQLRKTRAAAAERERVLAAEVERSAFQTRQLLNLAIPGGAAATSNSRGSSPLRRCGGSGISSPSSSPVPE